MKKPLLRTVLIATAVCSIFSLSGVQTSVAVEEYEVMEMMRPGTGYYGRGPGMMSRGVEGYGRGVNPNPQGWQDMRPEQREQWYQMRSRFMQDILPLRQELGAKQMEMEMLWDQRDPDPDKVRAVSERITELRSLLDQRYDEHLIQCRLEFGDRGWTCPGSNYRRY